MRGEGIFTTGDGEIIRATLFGGENLGSGPCIIFVHGFKGFKDWGFWPYMGEYLAARGYVVVSFNFSHNGVGGSLTEFDELDKFSQNTFSREVRELSEIIDACKSGFFGDMRGRKLGILGHSRGGGIALAACSGNSRNDVGAVALWSSVSTFDRYSDRQKELWRNIGYLEVVNQRSKQLMRMNATLLDDLERHKDDALDLEKAARGLNRPLLILHGEQDLSVPWAEGERLFEWSDRNQAEFHLIPHAGHTFGIVHPFAGSCEAFDSVLGKTESFFGRNLR